MRARRPSIADLDAILDVINDPASPHRQAECRHRDAPERASELYDRLDLDENLVLEQDGQVVAYASWQHFGPHAHLNVLAVAGSAQRQGLGGRMFGAFKAAIREDGAESYTLRAFADSPWALGFYERQGLAPVRGLAGASEGVLRYVRAAIADGDWPAEDKVLYYEAL